MGYGNCGGERTSVNGTESHCCYLQGEVCPLLVDWNGTVACSLMLLSDGDWATVEADSRYINWIKPRLDAMNVPNCKDWPSDGETCNDCGAIGSSSGGTIGSVPVELKQSEKRSLERDVVVPQLEAWTAAHPDEGN